MVVYADILIIVNFVVDYFLISIAAHFLNKKTRLWRLLLSAGTGGIFSLYIFLPESNVLFQTVIQIFMSMVLCLIALGFGNIKSFLKSTAVLFIVNFAYSGAMIAVWLIFKPHGMAINNSVVYFDISPLFLIIFSVIGYFAVVLLRKIFKKPFADSTYCTVSVFCGDKSLMLTGIADTGNSISDVFGTSEIFITEKGAVDALLGEQINNPARFRKIPCVTVTGEKLLDGYRIDYAEVGFNSKKYSFKNPVLAVSAAPLIDSQIIVNPESLN